MITNIDKAGIDLCSYYESIKDFTNMLKYARFLHKQIDERGTRVLLEYYTKN